jgi:hypothetical protein
VECLVKRRSRKEGGLERTALMSEVRLIGQIWQPGVGTCAYSYPLRPYDIENMRGEDGKIARCDIEDWLNKNAGDFSSVDDFAADIGTAAYGWRSEESEMTYFDCMYGDES